MAMEWSNEKVLTFLEALQTEPCLWDPRLKHFKNRASQNDAWRRLIELLPFETKIEELKKKKESLMGYYRTHLNKVRKSLMSGAGADGVYSTNWFAYETMDIFLRDIYGSNAQVVREDSIDLQSSISTDVPSSSSQRNSTATRSFKRLRPEAEADPLPEKIFKRTEAPAKPPLRQYSAFGEHIAERLRCMPAQMAIFCQKIINDAIYMAELNTLDVTSHIVTKKALPQRGSHVFAERQPLYAFVDEDPIGPQEEDDVEHEMKNEVRQ